MSLTTFFVFDVESVGLHGEGFAVAGGHYLHNGAALWEFRYSCSPSEAEGLMRDREWVRDNIPTIGETHRGTRSLRMAFWEEWNRARKDGALMAAECLWPVEARFVEDCIRDDAQRLTDAPYPIHDISSIMLAAGMDPMASYEREASEMPRHDPLADARQSARLLAQAWEKLGRNKPTES
jgi:hypothetical protein